MMKKEQALSMIRHTLTFVGGLLVMKGTIDEGTANEIAGAVVGLVGVVWGVIEKQQRPAN
jgi:hypothetical protein